MQRCHFADAALPANLTRPLAPLTPLPALVVDSLPLLLLL